MWISNLNVENKLNDIAICFYQEVPSQLLKHTDEESRATRTMNCFSEMDGCLVVNFTFEPSPGKSNIQFRISPPDSDRLFSKIYAFY